MKQFYLLASMLFLSVGLSAQIYVNAAASDGGDGATWATAYNSLDDALASASAGDAIWVAQGIYKPSGDRFVVSTGVSILGGFVGTETTAEEADPNENFSILSGDTNGDDSLDDIQLNREDNKRIVYVDSLISTATTFNGLAFVGGQTITGDENATLFDASGASIQALSPINVLNCLFTSNVADYGNVAIFDAATSGSRINNSAFAANLGVTRAAAVYANRTADLEITDCIFDGNVGERGAVYAVGVNGFKLENSDFTNNRALNNGGALGILFGANTEVTNCTFSNNEGDSRGGAVYIADDSSLPTDPTRIVFDNCEFETNNCGGLLGGAFYSLDCDYTIKNSSFDGNSAGIYGGGLFALAFDNERHIIIDSSSFTNNIAGINDAGLGGGLSVYNLHQLDISNTEFSGNGNNENTLRGSAAAIWGNMDTIPNPNNLSYNFDNVNVNGNNTPSLAGGLYFQTGSSFIDVNISNSSLINNVGTQAGGAIFSFSSVNINIDNVEASFNTSDDGGFLYVQSDLPNEGEGRIDALTTITNSVIHENFSAGQGGAIDAAGGADLNVYNSVFYGNALTGDSGSGGAIIGNGDSVGQVINLAYNTFVANSAILAGDDVAVYTSGAIPAESVTQLNLTNNAFVSTGAGVGNAAVEPDADGGVPVITSNGGNFFVQEPASTDNDSDIVDEDVEAGELFTQFDEGDLVEVNLTPNTDYAGNPLIDNGVVVEGLPTTDILGYDRGETPNIGAYETVDVAVNDIETAGLDISFFPNPVQDQMTVNVAEQGVQNISISVINIQGQRLFNWTLNNNNTIDFSNVPAGVYTLEVNVDGQLYSKQVVKQ